MAELLIQSTTLDNIAKAIRSSMSPVSTEKYSPAQMPGAIQRVCMTNYDAGYSSGYNAGQEAGEQTGLTNAIRYKLAYYLQSSASGTSAEAYGDADGVYYTEEQYQLQGIGIPVHSIATFTYVNAQKTEDRTIWTFQNNNPYHGVKFFYTLTYNQNQGASSIPRTIRGIMTVNARSSEQYELYTPAIITNAVMSIDGYRMF